MNKKRLQKKLHIQAFYMKTSLATSVQFSQAATYIIVYQLKSFGAARAFK